MAHSTSPNQRKQDFEKALVSRTNLRENNKFGLDRLDNTERRLKENKNPFFEDNELKELITKEHEIDSSEYLSTYSKKTKFVFLKLLL